jgi:hypothetical protein
MPAKTTLPYGTWPSPVTPQIAAAASRRFGSVQAVGEDLYWSEMRPDEGGRQVILRASGVVVAELLPAPFSARSRVHEYGGGEFLATAEAVFFANDADQQVYRLEGRGVPARITDMPGMRACALRISPWIERAGV